MKRHLIFVMIALALSAIIIMFGCTAATKSILSSTTSDQASKTGAPPPGQPGTPGPPGKPAPTDKQAPPAYEPPSAPDKKELPSSVALGEKDEVNQAGIKFAENVPGVKHVKTCYSRVFGGWYLFLYIPKGKEISLQQYSWNHKTKEWEFLYRPGAIAADKLDFHLKGELEDEKCFVLK